MTLEAKSIAESGATGWWTCNRPDEVTMPTNVSTEKITVKGLPHGTITFYWNVQGGKCDILPSEPVTFVNSAVVSHAGINHTVCEHNTVLEADASDLNYNASGIWKMTGDNIGTYTIESPTTYKTNIYDLAGGDYKFTWYVTSQDGFCESSSTVTVSLQLQLRHVMFAVRKKS